VTQPNNPSMEELRKKVHTYLATLTPEEAKALRAQFGLNKSPDNEDDSLRALARELSKLKKMKP
jgi:DNA-directed RNA polymerase sigma subunit (sigma70/sigma32)